MSFSSISRKIWWCIPARADIRGRWSTDCSPTCAGHLSGINGVLRPGIVHRIDKDTTGVLVVCKTDIAHQSLAEQLKEHSITRKYEAIVYNNFPEEEGVIDAPIGQKPCRQEKDGGGIQKTEREQSPTTGC